ncbi:MAG: ArnT family glycosyltransferase [Chloroflexota bacterium]
MESRHAAIVALAFWTTSVILAYAAQWFYSDRHTEGLGRISYILALLLAAAAAWTNHRLPICPSNSAFQRSIASTRHWADQFASLSIRLGLIADAGAALLLLADQPWPAAGLWILGTTMLTLGSLLGDAHRPQVLLNLPRIAMGAVAVLCVIGIAIWLRLDQLASLPAEIHNDEGAHGLQVRTLMSGTWPPDGLFGFGWSYLPILSYMPHAVTMTLLGDGLVGLRAASVVQGLCSIGLTFALFKALADWRVAGLAAALLSVAHWHVHYSRIGISNMGALMVSLLALLLTVRLAHSPSQRRAALVGVGFALCATMYFSARLTPVIALLYLAYAWFRQRLPIRQCAVYLLATAVTTLAVLAPFLVALWHSPDALTARLGAVSIFTPEFLQHSTETLGVSGLQEMIRLHTLWSLEGLVTSRDTSLHYNTPAPLLDLVSAPLVVLGFVYAAARMYEPRFFLLIAWFSLTLIFGSVLTDSAPFSPRMIGLIPVVAGFAGITIMVGWTLIRRCFGARSWPLYASLVAVWLSLLFASNQRSYFDTFAGREPLSITTAVARFGEALGSEHRLVVVHNGTTILTQETPRFINPRLNGLDISSDTFVVPLHDPQTVPGTAFIVLADVPDQAAVMRRIKSAHPGGHEQVHTNRRRTRLFTSYVVDHASP